MDVVMIVTVRVRIAKTVDAIRTDETSTVAIITTTIVIIAGIIMTTLEMAGMTEEVIRIVAMEIATVVVDIGDVPIT